MEKPNIIDIKSVIIELPKTSHKLSKTIKRAKNVSQISGACKNSTSPLYTETTKTDFFLRKKRL